MKAFVLLLLTAGAVWAECRTRLGVPCHTIEYRHSQWRLFARGLGDLYHHTARSVTSVRADGSHVWAEQSDFISLARGRRESSGAFMYLALPDRVVQVSHKNRTFLREVPRFWHDRPWRRSVEGDALCSTGIRHQGGDFRHTGTETLLGIRAQRWSRPLGNGGQEDIWLAPELDCLMLKRESVRRNALRWPVFIDSKEATSIRWGEPDAKLFVIPPDYREVSDQASLWR